MCGAPYTRCPACPAYEWLHCHDRPLGSPILLFYDSKHNSEESPEIAAVSARMRSLGLPCPGDQCIVNEYVPGHGIGAHVDLLPDFGDVVANVSLNGWCTMVLHPLPPC